MSTPSTATTVIAPHHHGSGHYGYVHRPAAYSAQPSPLEPSFASPARLSTTHQNYPSLSQHSRNSTASRQLAAVEYSPVDHYQQQYHHQQQQQQQQQQQRPHSHHLSTPVMSRRLQRKPNWREFYKNGIPKEIIVIDDDGEEEEEGSDPLHAQPAASGTAGATRSLAHTETISTTADGPATKKRRTNQAYQVAASSRDKPSYSNHNTPRYDNSGSGTISTDRSAELHTTAPTSLGSNGSSRSYVEPAATGQKRKRVTRQQTGADQKKKKREELAAHKSHLEYKAPTRIRKQKDDVKVRVEPDRHHGAQHKHDDDDGHYVIVDAAQLTERYQIRRLLGQGTFGKVVEAYDRQKRSMCAIKIIRSVQKYRDASRIELRVLSTLAHNDSENRNKCIHLRDCFDFRNHICIVTDLYGQSVFDFLKANSFVPFPSSQIQSFARQLFTSVAFLHDLDLIHTDLKPENILLVSNAYQTFTYNRQIPSSSMTVQRNSRQRRVLLDTEIRLIDFGSATFNDEYHSSVVSTRHYRAPEIILNMGWTFPCDIWSIGCILVEFFTGDALFQTHDNLEHLAMMEAVCNSKIETKIVRSVQKQDYKGNANAAAKYFKGTKLDYPSKDTSKASKKYVNAMKKLTDIIPNNTPFNKNFLDLLKRIFVYDPNKRITAKQALEHPWFKDNLIDDGTEAVRLKLEEQMRREQEAGRF